MCGLCGVIGPVGYKVKIEPVISMMENMVNRGPDSSGSFIKDNFGFGFRRLSIIDKGGSNQPIFNEDKSIVLILNGEIYNYLELRETLSKKGHKFNTNGDAEVVVHLYEEYGDKFLNFLNGMFALALCDISNNLIFLARDRLGIKPLYYSNNEGIIKFASDARALIRDKKPQISNKGFVEYLAQSYTSEQSIFEGIYKLPPASIATISNGNMTKKKYWHIDKFETYKSSQKDAEKNLLTLLKTSINGQLISDVPVGFFLSGGLDSSTIVALTSEIKSNKFSTFSVKYDGKSASKDAQYAASLSKKLGFEHHQINLTPDLAEQNLKTLLNDLDEPIADSAIIATYIIAKEAKTRGVKVLLSGAGADEIFGGYNRHQFSPSIGKLAIIKILNLCPNVFYNLLGEFKVKTIIDSSISYLGQISGINYSSLITLLSKNNKKYLNECFDTVRLRLSVNKYSLKNETYSAMYNDLQDYLVNDILALTDKATMACSVEARVPFLDHKLVEYSFQLPKIINLLKGEPKGLLKSLMVSRLGKKLTYRKKEGFNAPIRDWMTKEDIYLSVSEILNSPCTPLFDLIDKEKLKSIGYVGGAKNSQLVYAIKLFNDWYNINFGRP